MAAQLASDRFRVQTQAPWILELEPGLNLSVNLMAERGCPAHVPAALDRPTSLSWCSP